MPAMRMRSNLAVIATHIDLALDADTFMLDDYIHRDTQSGDTDEAFL